MGELVKLNRRGLLPRSDGNFLATDGESSHVFVERDLAVSWLRDRGLNPDGTRRSAFDDVVEIFFDSQAQEFGYEDWNALEDAEKALLADVMPDKG